MVFMFSVESVEWDAPPQQLSHSAARHKMAIRPKRTHGVTKHRRLQHLATPSPLPPMPEEENGRTGTCVTQGLSNDWLLN